MQADEWEVLPKSTRPRPRTTLGITRWGQFVISPGLYDAMGRPEYVQLLVKWGKSIGVRPAAGREDFACIPRPNMGDYGKASGYRAGYRSMWWGGFPGLVRSQPVQQDEQGVWFIEWPKEGEGHDTDE